MTPVPVVDIHTHFFGPAFFRSLALAAGGASPEPGLARLREAGVDVPEGSPGDHARTWLTQMDEHGVESMVTFASLPDEAESVAEGARASGGRLIPFALLDPTVDDAPDRVAGLADELGMRGVVLFPALHGYHPGSPSLDPVYREIAARGLPVIVHLGRLHIRLREILGLPAEFRSENARPESLRPAATRHPDLRFVIPHFGGETFEGTLALGADCANVGIDTSSSNSWVEAAPGIHGLSEAFRKALAVFGPERIHFGTDSSVFPRGWRHDIHREQLDILLSLGASRGVQERILGGNTRELLGLPAPPRSSGGGERVH